MTFLLGIAGCSIVFAVLSLLPPIGATGYLGSPAAIAAAALGVMFIVAGLLHFVPRARQTYLEMMPRFIPAPLLVIYVSGIFEIAGGIGMLVPATRRAAAIGLIALLVAVLPANFNAALKHVFYEPIARRFPIFLWVRLPLQFVFIALLAWSSQV